MKRFIIITMLIFNVGHIYSAVIETVIRQVHGQVFIIKTGTTRTVNAKSGDIINEDYSIETKSNSFADIEFKENAIIRIGEKTKVNFDMIQTNIKNNPDKKILFFIPKRMRINSVKLNLVAGRILSNVKSIRNKKSKFEIKTSLASIGCRGTIFDVSQGNTTNVKVLSGWVSVVNPKMPTNIVNVSQFQSCQVSNVNTPPSAPTKMSATEVNNLQTFIVSGSDNSSDATTTTSNIDDNITGQEPTKITAQVSNKNISSGESVSTSDVTIVGATVTTPNVSNDDIQTIEKTSGKKTVNIKVNF